MARSTDAPDQGELTRFLRALGSGGDESSSPAMLEVLAQLKATARGHMRRGTDGHTLQPSALVNEVYLKLFKHGTVEWADRVHFFALASRAMRQILLDHARKRAAIKGGGRHEALSICEPVVSGQAIEVDLLDLNEALEELSTLDERQGKVVELRYFGGLEVVEVGEVLSVSKTTVEREWRSARAWLGNRLKGLRES